MKQLLPSCEISSKSPRFANRAVANLSDVCRQSFCLQQSVPACGLTDVRVTMLSDTWDYKLSDFALFWSGFTIGRQFSVHSACSALTFRDFVPRLELLSPFRDILGIWGFLGFFEKVWKCGKWTISVYFANDIWFYF